MRNLAPLVLEPAPRFNVFFGDNGQGKTNLLETIYVVGTLRSFRTQRLIELIAFGATEAYIGARVERDGLERVYELTQQVNARRVRLDGKAVRPIARYFGDFNVVLFSPEDLQVPRGSPAVRRRFLDRAVFNRQPQYLVDVQAYEKIIKNRNALLRAMSAGKQSGKEGRDVLAVFDNQIAQLGARLVGSRLAFLDEIRVRFRSAFEAITHTGLEVDARYQAQLQEKEAEATTASSGPNSSPADYAARLLALLQRNRPRDLARGSTSVGPHRDDIQFVLNGREAASFASQGQLRAMVLAWKTAEMDLMEASHGDPPVLLLDDVSSELDPTRNAYLFAYLESRRSQCFITTTHARHVLLAGGRVDYEIGSGVVTRQGTF